MGKRKRSEGFFPFSGFPECVFDALPPNSTFVDNVGEFFKYARTSASTTEGSMCSVLGLEMDGETKFINLFTLTENVPRSVDTSCPQCRTCGWQSQYACKKNYHFIIPKENEAVPTSRKDNSHLLHAVIHSNGFGHILVVNGKEGGSEILRGKQIMDLWDRICTLLRPRKITVKDVSMKNGIALRLLYAVAYGGSWFSKWNYKFCHGSFGVTQMRYTWSRDYLSGLKVQNLLDFVDDQELNDVVAHYRLISETPLVTLRDFFEFMMVGKVFLNRVEGEKCILNSHLNILCNKLLLGYPHEEPVHGNMVVDKVQDILHGKVFVKEEWEYAKQEDDSMLRILCSVKPWLEEFYFDDLEKEVPPEEHVIVPCNATKKILMDAAQKNMRHTFFKTERIVIVEIEGTEDRGEDELLSSMGIGIGSKVCARVTNMEVNKASVSEIECLCGAREDDGEEMINCRICQTMYHYECLPPTELNERIYLCEKCRDQPQF